MTKEQEKQDLRRSKLMEFWKERHPKEDMTKLDASIMECLILLGEEYDRNYKHREREVRIYKLSNYLRRYLGIEIIIKDLKNTKSPTNENK